MKVITVYFSWDGKVESLSRIIQQQTGCDIFRIREVDSYPEDRLQLCTRVSQELYDGILPPYIEDVDIESYDVIFFGCPIWAHHLPPVVQTFIQNHSFSGKTVIPFCSCLAAHDAHKISLITESMQGCVSLVGYALTDTDDDFMTWLREIKINIG
jgi:flavodoxin